MDSLFSSLMDHQFGCSCLKRVAAFSTTCVAEVCNQRYWTQASVGRGVGLSSIENGEDLGEVLDHMIRCCVSLLQILQVLEL